MIFKRFRKADRPITVRSTEQVETWTQAISFEKPLPYVALVSDKIIAQSERLAVMLRQNGYRVLERDLSMRSARYVRPLPVWATHWCGTRIYGCYWQMIRWLYQHGVIRFAVGPEVVVRLRDMRPWPMKGYRA